MTKEKRKRNADRRVQPTSASRDAARTSGCARLSAFHYGSYRQGFRPLGATPGQASWDAAGRSIRQARSNRGAKTSRSYTGVTRARLSQSRERTSRTGRSAGQHDARSCPGAECIVPRAGTALAPPLGIPARQASSVSEIRCVMCSNEDRSVNEKETSRRARGRPTSDNCTADAPRPGTSARGLWSAFFWNASDTAYDTNPIDLRNT